MVVHAVPPNISDKQQRGYNSPSNGETKSPIKTGNMASEQGEQSPTITQMGKQSINMLNMRTKVLHMNIGVRAGGAAAPPKFWATQIFWAAKEIWAKPVLKEVSVFLFFEEIDIFYFNLKSAW